MTYYARLTQWPVGQGGFATGEILAGRTDEGLAYVYDCGSTRVDALRRSIANWDLRSDAIDLLFLSHLDADHVNGVELLTARYSVRSVVLPYLDTIGVAVVLGHALSTDLYSRSLAELVVNPHQWFAFRGAARVIFVERSQDDDPPPVYVDAIPDVPLNGDGGAIPSRNGDRKTTPLSVRVPAGALGDDLIPIKDADQVSVLRAGHAFTVVAGMQRLWLLAPFVPPVEAWRMGLFRRRLVQIGFLAPKQRRPSISQVLSFLEDPKNRKWLKRAYEEISGDHNRVSMSLFSGPAAPGRVKWTRAVDVGADTHAWMYTGDCPLRLKAVRTAWQRQYRPLLSQVGIFVAPHHGSKYNFSVEALRGLKPSTVIFAVGRNNAYGHPHGDTVATFVANGVDICKVTESVRTIAQVHIDL